MEKKTTKSEGKEGNDEKEEKKKIEKGATVF